MTLLQSHLEQIALSSVAIRELDFPPPKIFTNAILRSHDITALIRDTEAHERALFTLAAEQEDAQPAAAKIARRSTIHGAQGHTSSANARKPGQKSTLATFLGGNVGELVRGQGLKQTDHGEADIEGLLNGAERLCKVYPVAGAPERILNLRSRFERLQSSISYYQDREAKQSAQLARLKEQRGTEDPLEGTSDVEEDEEDETSANIDIDERIRIEEQDIKALEEKKRALEERVSGMEKDLGGLLR